MPIARLFPKTKLSTLTALTALGLSLFVGFCSNAFASENIRYDCGGNGFTAGVKIIPEEGRTVITTPRGSFNTSDRDGVAVNEEQELQFDANATPPTLFIGSEQFSCRNDGPITYANQFGLSTGGNVRSTPDTRGEKLDTLAAATPIRIVTRLPFKLDGFNWFEIRYGPNFDNTGYHWGGIMCANSKEVTGVLSYCKQ